LTSSLIQYRLSGMNTYTLQSHPEDTAGRDYYDGPDLVAGLVAALREAGLDPDHLDVDDLAALDEFHAQGRPATLSLAQLAEVGPEDRVLDIGAGIGGPARVLSSLYGAHVTALDATSRFCRAAEVLTSGAGLADRVEIVCADALDIPFPDASFDLVWTQAVSQNIADKRRFMDELARVVTPGGRVALFELVAGPGGAIEYPVPWADGPSQSWLPGGDELYALLDSGPLTVTAWRQGPAVIEAIARAAQSSPLRMGDSGHSGLGLHLLMPEYEARMASMARNVTAKKVALVQAIAQRR
jgi:MPBQ/MSBQ methyltransferase